MSDTPNIQLVLTDFDGTVVEFGKHLVSDNVRQAVIACEDRGVRTVPVTGRHYNMSRPVLELLGFEDLGIFDNGATIQNCKTGEIVWSQWLDAELVRQVVNVCLPVAILLDFSEDHADFFPSADNPLDISQITNATSHVYAIVSDAALADTLDSLAKIEGITFYTAPSIREGDVGLSGIQITHIDADKYHGVNALRNIINVDKAHTLAIGDGANDIALFKNAKIKVAMGNATDELKAAADYVTSSVQEDGFVEAMQRFVLVD